jgi:hypothetical protein
VHYIELEVRLIEPPGSEYDLVDSDGSYYVGAGGELLNCKNGTGVITFEIYIQRTNNGHS